MKKLIAISVMLALIAGAVFADTSVSGAVETRLTLVTNSGAKDAKNHTKVDGIAEGYIQVSGSNDEGTIGGAFRIKPYYTQNWEGNGIHKANVWWQPIPQLKIFLGKDDDGMFGTDELVSFNFYGSGTNYLSLHSWDLWRSFYPGNWDSYGLAFIIKPVDGLEVDATFNTQRSKRDFGDMPPDPYVTDWRTNDFFKTIRISASYSIENIGKIFFVYNGPANFETPTYTSDALDDAKLKNNGQVAASFQLTAVEGFKIQPAFALKLNNGETAKLSGGRDPATQTHIGLAVWYTGEGFAVKLRGGYILNYGGEQYGSNIFTGDDKRNRLIIGVLPSYAISDSVTAYLQFEYDKASNDGNNEKTEINVFPSVKASFGPGALGIGVKITSSTTGKADAVNSWSVPLRFVYSF